MFQYIARLTKECQLLHVEPLSSAAPLCGEMVIHSKLYDTIEECMTDASGLISAMAKLISQISGEKFIAISKDNPLYNGGNEEHAAAEGWASNTIHRIYAAHSKSFKKTNILVFTIHANVNVLETAPSSSLLQ